MIPSDPQYDVIHPYSGMVNTPCEERVNPAGNMAMLTARDHDPDLNAAWEGGSQAFKSTTVGGSALPGTVTGGGTKTWSGTAVWA
jgi:hypothetical protein